MVVCINCGNEYLPETLVGNEEGTDSDNKMDCRVYICDHCGGEIIFNGTEGSGNCVYCGNPSVVFSRISKTMRPDGIIPFSISEEDAVRSLRESLSKRPFVPSKIKNINVEYVRGIYIPYWISGCTIKGSAVATGTVRVGKRSRTVYYGRAGRMRISGLPIDASTMLPDEISSKLEPFGNEEIRKFNDNYLMGFYSDMSDIRYRDLRKAVNRRADLYFRQEVKKSVHTTGTVGIHSMEAINTLDYDNLKYVLMPAWFVTYTYKDRNCTILINGQTGKTVCGIPWNKPLFYSFLMAAGAVLTTLIFPPMRHILTFLQSSGRITKESSYVISLIILCIAGLFTHGIYKIRKVGDSIKLTQSDSVFNFVKKRQG